MNYITKDKQDPELRKIIEDEIKIFSERFPVKTIGNHHYIRRRHLEQFIYTLIKKL